MRTVKSSSGVQLVDDTTRAGRSTRRVIWCVVGSCVVSRSVLRKFEGRGGDRVGIKRSNS